MCFSATASFTAGVVLGGIGTASLMKAKKQEQYLFAGIPWLFAIQQVAEGVVWLSLGNKEFANYNSIGTFTFLFFALVVWPTWVPLAIRLLEPNAKRKRILGFLALAGAVVSIPSIYLLATGHIFSEIRGYHIFYQLNFSDVVMIGGGILYFLSTIVSPFVSSIRKMNWIAVSILASYVGARVFFSEYALSVWCFFAAIISVLIYMVMRDIGKKTTF